MKLVPRVPDLAPRLLKEAAVAQGTKAYGRTTVAKGSATSGGRLAVDLSAGALAESHLSA